MASTQSRLFNALLRIVNKKTRLNRKLRTGKLNSFSCNTPPPGVLRTCHVHKFKINGRNVFTLKPRNRSNSGRHILYLHGGAYVQGFVKPHWDFLTELIKETGCNITAPDYPLAPDFTYRDAYRMVEMVYRELIATTNPGDLILMGDSAGGGFALALAQKMKAEKVNQPEQIILLSPWLDITLTNPDIINIDPEDPFLGKEAMQKAGKLYAGDTTPDSYLLSPLNGFLEGLGKISVFIGSKEILAADARKLKHLAELKGIRINYFEYADMVHAWMFLNFPESKKARQQISELVLYS